MSSQARAQVCRIIPFAIDLCGRVKCFRFLENLQGLSVVCTEGDTAHVNVLVAHGDKAEVLLAGALTSGSEEGDCATVRGLGSNPPVVGVHFGIEDADVHVFTGCHDVVETTVTDISWAFPHIYVWSGYILGVAIFASLVAHRLKRYHSSAPRGHYP